MTEYLVYSSRDGDGFQSRLGLRVRCCTYHRIHNLIAGITRHTRLTSSALTMSNAIPKKNGNGTKTPSSKDPLNPSGLPAIVLPRWEDIELEFKDELAACPSLRWRVKIHYDLLWDRLLGPLQPGESRERVINSVVLGQRIAALRREQAEDGGAVNADGQINSRLAYIVLSGADAYYEDACSTSG